MCITLTLLSSNLLLSTLGAFTSCIIVLTFSLIWMPLLLFFLHQISSGRLEVELKGASRLMAATFTSPDGSRPLLSLVSFGLGNEWGPLLVFQLFFSGLWSCRGVNHLQGALRWGTSTRSPVLMPLLQPCFPSVVADCWRMLEAPKLIRTTKSCSLSQHLPVLVGVQFMQYICTVYIACNM